MAKSTPAGGAKKSPAAKAPAKKAAAKKPPVKASSSAARAAGKVAVKSASSSGSGSKSSSGTTATKSPFPPKFLDQQRKALLDERATYTRQANNLQAEADSLVADFEPGDVQFDEESGEGDTLNIERERDLALSAQARAQIEEIDRALAKLDNGTYGLCEVSGD